MRKVLDRLPERIRKRIRVLPDGCWQWQGKTTTGGYGQIRLGGVARSAHIVVREIVTGQQVLPGMIHRHLCNNPACVRPDHVVPGTQWENMQDRERAGHTAKGSHNGRAKLDEQQVQQILQRLDEGETQAECARQFGVSDRTIRYIAKGQKWQHVQRI